MAGFGFGNYVKEWEIVPIFRRKNSRESEQHIPAVGLEEVFGVRFVLIPGSGRGVELSEVGQVCRGIFFGC